MVRSQPGLKGREIAGRLKADKSEVNSILWKLQNRGLTRQDNAYRWFIGDSPTSLVFLVGLVFLIVFERCLVFDAVTATGDGDDLGVMQEAVEDGARELVVDVPVPRSRARLVLSIMHSRAA